MQCIRLLSLFVYEHLFKCIRNVHKHRYNKHQQALFCVILLIQVYPVVSL